MNTGWKIQDIKTLKRLVEDGVKPNLLKKYFSGHSGFSIFCKLKELGFKNTVGYEENTAGTSRTTGIVQEPTIISESLDNLSDEIVANNTQNINSDALKHICDDVNNLLHNEKYLQIASITVTLENTVLTVTKGSS